jgi:hypothetical protein
VREEPLRKAFWDGLSVRIAARPDWGLGHFRHVHGNEAYIEFDEPLALGFHQRAVFLLRDNQLRAEIHTMSRHGIEFLDRLIAAGPTLATSEGGIAEVRVSRGRSDGKIQIVWRDAMTGNRRLWQVHHDWIGETLRDLRKSVVPLLPH